MARTIIETLLPLDHYAELLQLTPSHFNQVVSAAIPEVAARSSLWFQHGWMGSQGRASRQELASTIMQAEELIKEMLRFGPAPEYINSERHPVFQTGLPPLRYQPLGRQRLTVSKAHLLQIGKQKIDLVELDVPIVRSDPDGDDWSERVTITLTDADLSEVDSVNELVVVKAGGDGTDKTQWIRHLSKTLEGTTFTAVGRSSWFVEPDLWEIDAFINGDDPDNFLATVDIYRVYYVQTGDDPAVLYEYESSSYPTTLLATYGVGTVHDGEGGIMTVAPATWSDDTDEWTITTLDQVATCGGLLAYINVWYVAGMQLDSHGRVRNDYARAVAALATARLTMPVTGGGESVNKMYNFWQAIPDRRDTTFKQRDCPYGPQRGAWEAWNFVVRFMRRLEGSSI